ncbi:ABC transporter permease [Halobellus captivus]|uniref:ABC transporter permease n=1 Tax=Halobellus captivus TaxID=2592614 RepID=UPI0011A7BB83|nr:ABC transporter permease [Halobellus captivus]
MVKNNLSLMDNRFANNYVVRNVVGSLRLMLEDKATMVYFSYLVFVLFLGAFGPMLAPYPYDETLYVNGEILRSAPPSLAHPLGTNNIGQDIFSRLLYGARPTMITGLLGGSMIISIGMTVGVTAGYVGGRVDNTLMRITDVVYGVPLIPFAIVLVSLFGIGFVQSIVVIGLLLWRGNARVLRSQVLQIRERPFILASKAAGASRTRIVFKHVLPNIAPMAVLFFSLGIGFSILIQATLAFLGVTSPFIPSWGVMVRSAYNSGLMSQAWWWSLPPGLMIAFTVLATFMFGRSYENIAGQGNEEAFVQAG